MRRLTAGSPSLVNGAAFRSQSLSVRRFESCPRTPKQMDSNLVVTARWGRNRPPRRSACSLPGVNKRREHVYTQFFVGEVMKKTLPS